MNLRLHLYSQHQINALLTFLKTAIEFQEQRGAIIDTSEPNDEYFLDQYGFTKQELQDGLDALKSALK